MNDKEYLKRQRVGMLCVTTIWFSILGSLALYLWITGRFSNGEALLLGIGWGLCPPLGVTLLNWNDTSRYS